MTGGHEHFGMARVISTGTRQQQFFARATMFFHWSVFCFKSSPVKMSSMSLRRCSVHKTPALRKAMYAGVSSALPAGAPRSIWSNRGEMRASPFWSSKSMAVSSGVRAVDINYLLCAQAVASHGVALAVTREERSAAMQETALAAVGQRCEPLARRESGNVSAVNFNSASFCNRACAQDRPATIRGFDGPRGGAASVLASVLQ